MVQNPIMGRLIKLDHKRRCDFCEKPVSVGYKLNIGPTQGFFCGVRHVQAAHARMEAIKTEQEI